MALNDNVRCVRKAKGFSQEYMAEMLCIHQSAYSRIESNEQACIDRLPALSKVLGLSQVELIDYNVVHSGSYDYTNSHHSFSDLLSRKDRIIAQRDEEIGFLKSQISLLKSIWDSYLKHY